VNVISGFSSALLDFLDFGAVGKAPGPKKTIKKKTKQKRKKKNRSGTPEVAETADDLRLYGNMDFATNFHCPASVCERASVKSA